MRTVEVGGVTLGAGMPKICIPVTGTTGAQILEGARQARAAQADICEWRADFFQTLEEAAIAQMIAQLREALAGIPLLFTIRTRAEGGKATIPPADYARLNRCAAQHGAAIVDVELSMPDAASLIRQMRAQGVPVIASSHDFQKTPESRVLLERIGRMRACGADVAKIAVMPQSVQDVLRLLAVTHEAAQGEGPVVTMAMGRLGAISRLAGETFGSAMTFGAAGQGSAPGQIDAKTLRAALSAMHEV